MLVNIWATWCPPCVEEMPSMEKLYRKLKGQNFEILAVSIDEPGLKAVAPFMKKSNLTFPALIDSEGIHQSCLWDYRRPGKLHCRQAGDSHQKNCRAGRLGYSQNFSIF